MGIIHQLSQHVANQIAAGEVVERPCSVVKELIENSIDAKAHRIDVSIKNGGFEYLVVQDDGIGMDEADLSLCVKRYATSKLEAVSDLDRLVSFGFRGEAIPSIAAISRMSITSRQADETFGLKAVIEMGTIQSTSKAGAQVGTRMEVRDLFYNVPARLKFAKSKRTETGEIERLLKAYAFIYPHIAWSLSADERMIFSCDQDSNARIERGHVLLGSETKGHLYEFSSHSPSCQIEGVIAAPMVSRRDTRAMVTFVNNRLVVDRKLIMAIKNAFSTVLEVGYQPVCALNIHCAPDEIDVNIHPRKTEVRFKNERQILGQLINSLAQFLSQTPWLAHTSSQIYSPKTAWEQNTRHDGLFYSSAPRANKQDSIQAFMMSVMPQPQVQKPLLLAKRFSDLKIVGQVMATYLVLEGEQGLIVVDQHAAHERVMYERIKKQRASSVSSPLLIPVTLAVCSLDMALVAEHHDELFQVGFEIEPFGQENIIVRSVPDYVSHASISDLVKHMLADLATWSKSYAHRALFDHVCATLACHASIRAGQTLAREEIEALLVSLDDTDFGAHCPHGRPIVKSFAKAEVKSWFDRT